MLNRQAGVIHRDRKVIVLVVLWRSLVLGERFCVQLNPFCTLLFVLAELSLGLLFRPNSVGVRYLR